MLLIKEHNTGDLRSTIFDFEVKGDILPKHVHNEWDVHITIVARGSVRASSHDWSREVKAGGIIDFRPGEPHEIVALEDSTRIINVRKRVLPTEPTAVVQS